MVSQLENGLALVGFGIAGRARHNAFQDKSNPWILKGIVSRRPEWATLSWAECLQDPSIHAVAISTENTAHAIQVEEALKANKHVLCDYPLCFLKSDAEKLYALAHARKKILHVEHIGLLSSSHQEAKAQMASMGPLKKADYIFTGGWPEKIQDNAYSGPLPFLALSRLVQLADFFGPYSLTVENIQISAQQFNLQLLLEPKQGGTIHFVENRQPQQSRSRSLNVEFLDGTYQWKQTPQKESLFLKDMIYFFERIHQNKEAYFDEEFMMGLIDQLSRIPQHVNIS